jgi:hypothetical protein
MKVGDLVRYSDKYGFLWAGTGIIVREIPGWGEIKVVRWFGLGMSSHPAKTLEVISESR